MKPRKIRNVLYPPGILHFKPVGVSKQSSSVFLTIDEYEAIRLADYEKLKQEEAAKRMNISRPTFTRLIDSARKKISEAIVNGKAIKIEGGSFIFLKNRSRCKRCGYVWENIKKDNLKFICPRCGSSNIEDIGKMIIRRCQGKRWRGGSR